MAAARASTRGGARGAATGAALRHEPVTPTINALLAGIQAFLSEPEPQTSFAPPHGRALLSSISMVPDDMVQDALDAIAATRVGARSLVEFIEDRLSKGKAKPGRPATIPVTALLVAAVLCAVDFRETTGVQISRLLYRRISDAARRSLGVRTEPVPELGSKRRLWEKTRARRAQRAMRRLCHVFDPSPYPKGKKRSWVELDQLKRTLTIHEEQELQQALDLLTTAIQGLCWHYLPEDNHAMYDGSACIDATPLPLFARGLSVHDEVAGTDPDGGFYVRTGDHNGEQDIRKAFFALDIHLIVGADITREDRRYLPGLPLAMTAGRPGVDPAGAARRLMAALAGRGHRLGYLAGDNLYLLANAATFQQPARELGWRLVLPYPSGHTGRQTTSSGATLVEGSWYCCAMPEPLVTATEDLRDKKIDDDTYDARIGERRSFELRPKEKPSLGQPARMQCPAAGASPTAKCPLKERSEQPRPTTVVNGQKVDLRPRIAPSPEQIAHPPKVCRQDTITIGPAEGAKYRQGLRYGSPEWARIYNSLRETQEGLHGFSKDDAREALAAGQRRRVRGLAANSITASILIASAGIRKVRTFLQAAVPDERGVLYVPRDTRQRRRSWQGDDLASDC